MRQVDSIFSGVVFLLLLAPVAAMAQQADGASVRPLATSEVPHVPSPWWMRDPAIAAVGQVHAELPANRASFSATFTVVARDVAEASRRAAEASNALDARLQDFGETKVRFTRMFGTEPLYRQYRDGDGNRVDNERADQIENYAVTATFLIIVSDVSVVEDVYNIVVQASPTSSSQIDWSLEPTDAMRTALEIAAARDAAQRARSSVEAVGANLGQARLIDPSGNACQTPILTGWNFNVGSPERSRDVSGDIIVNSRTVAAPPPVSAADTPRLTLRPPLRRLSETSCVIFSLR